MSFRAATYNILATAYIRPERYPAVPPALLDPAWRPPALVGHVAGLDAGLLCLQEVEAEVFTAMSNRLGPLGYEGPYLRKGGGRPDGCATFFRTDTLTFLRGVQRLHYHDRGEEGADDSGHVALLLALEYEGRLLGIVNTHLRWDPPGTPRPRQVGLRQIEELLEAIGWFTPRCDGWLVCGDFNCTDDSDTATVLRAAGYEHAHAGRSQVRSCVANGRARLIDFLFHTAALRPRPVDPPPVADDTALPSEQQPSDHLPLLAEFDWA